MTIAPLKLGFTPEAFTAYVKTLGRLEWPAKAVTIHNTFMPNLKMVDDYIAAKKWTPEQLIENWWTMYRQKGWYSGPHIFVFRDKIYVASPLTLRGTHSPSFNKDHFGIELLGDYSKEILPDSIRSMGAHAAAVLLNKIGAHANMKTVKFHGDDPKTTHRGCPGKNVGTKADWIAAIEAAQRKLIF